MDIIGYEGLYTIDREGKVFGKKHKKYLKPQLTNEGYYRVDLSKNGIITHFSIHRLIASHYIPNPLNLPCVDHQNGVKSDNRIVNLRWATVSQNGMNCKKSENNTSGFRGVCFHKNKKNFVAQIKINNKTLNLGSFDTAEEASAVYEAKATELFGEFKRD